MAETQESVGTPDAAPHEQPALLQFDPGIGIWTLIAFVLLLVLLKRFAWKPMLNAIDERDRKMKESLSAADRIGEESRQRSEEQKKILAESHEQAAKIVGEARLSAESLKDQILDSAQQEKARMMRNASEEISSLTVQAKSELRAYSAELAVKAAEKILQDQLDQDKAKKLADKMVQEFNP
ncbi:MAG TPA: F0F1 ATP synthase subunit B [Fibrobacteraceae bacterium]|nr:F0F1 ATP synthase subunit B [Fibrobacteraceae bacterium]